MKKIFTLLGLMLCTQFVFAQMNCAGLNASIGTNINGLSVQFSNTSNNANVASSVKLSTWTFGDGTSGMALFPMHTYATAGTYNVMMINTWLDTFNNATICIDTAYTTVTVPGGNPANNVISGTISWDTTGNLLQSAFKVWLIVLDSSTNILHAIDSVNTGGVLYANYSFSNVAPGVYRTKAAQTGASQLMPTYHQTSLYWSQAQQITHAGGTTSGKDIYLAAGNPGSGPGFVGGNIAQGANKGTTGGIPNMLVFLRDGANAVVAATYTDANGDYSFSNLPLGAYNVYPEAINYATTPSTALTLTGGQASVNAVDFERSLSNMTIQPKSLSVGKVAGSDLFAIYPNPSNGVININWKNGAQGEADITVTDMSGRTVLRTQASMNQTRQLNATHLQQGIYFVKIVAGAAQHTEKIVITK